MPLDTAGPGHARISDVTGISERTFRQKVLASQPFWVTVALLVLSVAISLYQPSFFTVQNIANITRNFSPFGIMALGMTCVIVTGGIDLSVGSIMGLVAIVAGLFLTWEYPWWLAFGMGLLAGLACGAVNGFLIAFIGYPALITTLATYYAFSSLAIVINDQQPISTDPIQAFFSAARSVPIGGGGDPLQVPLGILTFLLPTAVVIWLVLNRTTYGRRLYAIGTNDVAAQWSGIDVRKTRFLAYVAAGVISGLVAVVTVAQFASARPDAGVAGSGMALPAITIAVLGGVAITGGIGRVACVVLATLLIVWLNAGILLAVPGNAGSQFQLFALGTVLIFAALLNGLTQRKYGGTG